MLSPLPDGLTHATLASRARVIVFDTRMVARGNPVPAGLNDLLSPSFKGRIGVARPQFGTTRAHIAALRHGTGKERFAEWCKAMRDAGVRQYAGNSSVVRAVADGEIAAGLTDTDDVWAGKRNGWPVDMAYPRDAELVAAPMLIPNTVALIKNDAPPANAIRLVDFLRGETVERLMVESELKHIPRRRELLSEFPDRVPAEGVEPDWLALDAVSDEAVGLWEQIVGV
jgi:iron(III) transport system substrate-binding protein